MASITALIEGLLSSDKEKTLSNLIRDLKGKGNATCFVVDEANQALPVATDSESAQRALQYFVMLTKETSIASVVLISSELGYPYRLQACGMNLRDIRNIIIANEVPKEEMLKLMVNRWNMSETHCRGILHLLWRRRWPLLPRSGAIANIWEGFWPFCFARLSRLAVLRVWPSSKEAFAELGEAGLVSCLEHRGRQGCGAYRSEKCGWHRAKTGRSLRPSRRHLGGWA